MPRSLYAVVVCDCPAGLGAMRGRISNEVDDAVVR